MRSTSNIEVEFRFQSRVDELHGPVSSSLFEHDLLEPMLKRRDGDPVDDFGAKSISQQIAGRSLG